MSSIKFTLAACLFLKCLLHTAFHMHHLDSLCGFAVLFVSGSKQAFSEVDRYDSGSGRPHDDDEIPHKVLIERNLQRTARK